MDFTISKEYQMARKMMCDFAQKEMAPGIKEADRKQKLISDTLRIAKVCRTGWAILIFKCRWMSETTSVSYL